MLLLVKFYEEKGRSSTTFRISEVVGEQIWVNIKIFSDLVKTEPKQRIDAQKMERLG